MSGLGLLYLKNAQINSVQHIQRVAQDVMSYVLLTSCAPWCLLVLQLHLCFFEEKKKHFEVAVKECHAKSCYWIDAGKAWGLFPLDLRPCCRVMALSSRHRNYGSGGLLLRLGCLREFLVIPLPPIRARWLVVAVLCSTFVRCSSGIAQLKLWFMFYSLRFIKLAINMDVSRL
jgi:hypothetical protein